MSRTLASTDRDETEDLHPPTASTVGERSPVPDPPSVTKAERPIVEAQASGEARASFQDRAQTTHQSTETYFQSLAASRYRSSLWLIGAMMVFAFLTVPVSKDPTMRIVGGLGLGWISVGLAVLRWHTRPGKALRRDAYDRVVITTLAGLIPLIYFFGTYMPFAGLIGLLMLGYHLSAEPRLSLLATLIVGGSHVVIHLLITTGVVPDRGMLRVEGDLEAKLMNLASVIAIYAFSFGLGQIFRRRTKQTMSELEEAVRQVAAREALLREARLDLERAAGIGQAGRFTDQHLGSFVLGPILGRGGMGEIYEARHLETQEPAAVKLLRRPDGSTDNLLQRFVREAELARAIESPHVVRVLEVGGLDAPLPYIAMERLIGTDLAQLLRRQPRLSPQEVTTMVKQIAEGLRAAGKHGIVHRDIKPQNLFHCADGAWKILDFGVARVAGDSRTLTGTNLVGTPAYMAPEQLDERAVLDHRTDIHALAVVAYRGLTGRPAFAGRDVAAIFEKIARELPARPSSLSSVPLAVDEVLRIAMAKKPSERFESAPAFAEALAEACAGRMSSDIATRAARLSLDWPSGA